MIYTCGSKGDTGRYGWYEKSGDTKTTLRVQSTKKHTEKKHRH